MTTGAGRGAQSAMRVSPVAKIVTVTKQVEKSRCRWCGVALPDAPGPGRRREFCRRSHRQRLYEARRLAAVHELGPDDVLLSRHVFEELRDRLYRLEAALEDTAADLAGSATATQLREVLDHLRQRAGELVQLHLEPKAVGQ